MVTREGCVAGSRPFGQATRIFEYRQKVFSGYARIEYRLVFGALLAGGQAQR